MEANLHGVRRSAWLAALASGLLVGATASVASAGGVIGSLTIKGKRYVNGEVTTVNCSGDVNLIDGALYGQRTMYIDPSCPLYPDTGQPDVEFFRFLGEEEQIVVNGTPKNVLIFSGTQEATGPAFGAAHSEQKFKDDGEFFLITSEKGRMTYSYFDDGENSIIFVGTFKAKYE